MHPDYYRLLDIPADADESVIRRTVNGKIRQCQSHANSPDEAVRRTAQAHLQELLAARDVLLDASRRREYDQRRAPAAPGAESLPADRPAEVHGADGRLFRLRYDAAGNVIEVGDSECGVSRFVYDALNRPVRHEYQEGRRVVEVRYDASGNRGAVRYPECAEIRFAYSPAGLPLEACFAGRRTRWEYDAAGRLVREILPNQVTISCRYGADGVTHLEYRNGRGETLLTLEYAFDAMGNCRRRRTVDARGEVESEFLYDGIYRLRGVRGRDGRQVRYRYDEFGNRLSVSRRPPRPAGGWPKLLWHVPWRRERCAGRFDDQRRLRRAGELEYEHDSAGNMVRRRTPAGDFTFAYGPGGLLTSVTRPDGAVVRYHYDFWGRRIGKTFSDGRRLEYLYDGLRLVQERDERGRLAATYFHGPALDRPIAVQRGPRCYFYLYDPLGSVIALSDETGALVETYEYDEWGRCRALPGTLEQPFRFTGREWDEESGLYCFRARYYDPVTGRFLTPDPLGGGTAAGDRPGRYCYVHNNPLSHTDPLGLFFQPPPPFYNNTRNWWSNNPLFQQPNILPIHSGGMPWSGWPSNLQSTWQSVWNPTWNYVSSHWEPVGNTIVSTGSNLLDMSRSHFRHLTNTLPTVVDYLPLAGHAIDQNWTAFTADFIEISGSVATGEVCSHYLGLTLGTVGFGVAGFPGAFVGYLGGRVLGEMGGAWIGQKIFDPIGEWAAPHINRALQNSWGALQEVGGVLFDQAAEVVTDLEEIGGAYWDETLGQLVLVGRKRGGEERRLLPRLDKDHLAVAIRAAFAGEDPGVSIDPPPGYMESGVFPPSGMHMPVRYLGGTRNTLFGAILFEADRLLKNLSMGIDNVTGKPVSSCVSGFQNELELHFAMGGESSNSWNRMWFMIEEMRIELDVRETADRGALHFGRARMKVKAEFLCKEGEEKPGADPVAEHFTQHFTLHFDDFAAEFPVLGRLRELAKVAAVAKWLRQSGKPVDLACLGEYRIAEVPTPDTTPGIVARASRSERQGTVTHTRTFSLYGGVDFHFAFDTAPDDGRAAALREESQRARPAEDEEKWSLLGKEAPALALAMPLQAEGGVFRTVHDDWRASDGVVFGRRYHSRRRSTAGFGGGWEFALPFALTWLGDRRDENGILLLYDGATDETTRYVSVPEEGASFPLQCERNEEGRRVLVYTPTRPLRRLDDGTFSLEIAAGETCAFTADGRPSAVTTAAGTTRYIHRDGRLCEVLFPAGERLGIEYDADGRPARLTAAGGETVVYTYDVHGRLLRVEDRSGCRFRYAYDEADRLIKARDAGGRVLFRHVYDRLGRPVRARTGERVTPSGLALRHTFGEHGPTAIEDGRGNRLEYGYDAAGNLTGAVWRDPLGRETRVEYNGDERPAVLVDALGGNWRFAYDDVGRLSDAVDPVGRRRRFAYTAAHRVKLAEDADGRSWQAEYDERNRLTALTAPGGDRLSVSHDESQLRLGDGRGENRCLLDEKGRLRRLIDANGNATEFFYDEDGRPVRVRNAEGQEFALSETGGITAVRRSWFQK